ncbi:antibiotic biosynthesis monooxygenase [Tabrizicola sp. J26]|uniref:putative quinol monooxygenase n=1 Tax=Alitabrizicola rongguiensis TaxID=2909234 RepID=UPI001F29BFC9|nr:antibiotic biosynthesis monooxygenase [Tabrizicola rongguiensis]MCF1708933.1 antibiotic biosynthesis monooxygenase [Tabrizicola rongguiensis]
MTDSPVKPGRSVEPGRGPVRLAGLLRCDTPADADLVRLHLPNHERLSRAEPGCLCFAVTPTDDPLVWRVEELFADRAAFDHHQIRTRASEWFRATAHIRREYNVTAD